MRRDGNCQLWCRTTIVARFAVVHSNRNHRIVDCKVIIPSACLRGTFQDFSTRFQAVLEFSSAQVKKAEGKSELQLVSKALAYGFHVGVLLICMVERGRDIFLCTRTEQRVG